MKKAKKQSIEDKGQSSIFDFGGDLFTKEEKLELIQASQNRLEDPRINDTDIIRDKEGELEKELEKELEDILNLRSEQIIVSKENYPTISDSDSQESIYRSIDNISGCNHKSKNLFNQCLFQIRQAFFGKIDLNSDGKLVSDKEKELRIKIRSALNKFKNAKGKDGKGFNYKNTMYKLLDKYFKDDSKICNKNIDDKNDNYSWSPQAAQQTIDLAVEAWYDNDLARVDYPKHPQDYTGKPGIVGYRKGSEYITVFTNQQCHIETKDVLDIDSMNEERLRYERKNFVIFPDHLNIKPIETRLPGNGMTDLREVRIIPQTKNKYYKVELIYKKVIDKIKIKLKGIEKTVKINELNLDPLRIIGIDTGQENVVTIGNKLANFNAWVGHPTNCPKT